MGVSAARRATLALAASQGAGDRMKPSKIRIGLETAVALLAGLLGAVTIFWHDWIEALTGLDPDQGNGSAEWLIVASLLVIAIAMGTVARRHWRMRLVDSE
jgi:hypothetical protein